MTPEIKQYLTDLGMTSGTMSKLNRYVDSLTHWNKAINLVAPSTIKDIWSRHILDSAQLWPVISSIVIPAKAGIQNFLDPRVKPEDDKINIIDLGSGGGLPGLILAMLGAEHVTLVESDKRKCVFMREVSREIGLNNVTIINERIEKADNITAPIITARALAPLEQLIAWSTPLLQPAGKMVFLKGQDVSAEMAALPDNIRNQALLIDSITDPKARIVVI